MAAGETVFDVLVNGASIYASGASDDQRPRFAFHASELRQGDEAVLATAEHATGGVPARAKVQLRWWAA